MAIIDMKIRSMIKKLLKDRDLKYRALAVHLGVSEGSVKQLMTKGLITTRRLEEVAAFFGLGIDEFFQLISQKDEEPYSLSLRQEELVARNPLNLRLLLLLRTDMNIQQVKIRVPYATEQEIKKSLMNLEKADLITLHKDKLVRMRARGPFRFSKDGPVEKKFRGAYLQSLTRQIRKNPGEDTFQRTFELYGTPQFLDQMKIEISQLVKKMGLAVPPRSVRISERNSHSNHWTLFYQAPRWLGRSLRFPDGCILDCLPALLIPHFLYLYFRFLKRQFCFMQKLINGYFVTFNCGDQRYRGQQSRAFFPEAFRK